MEGLIFIEMEGSSLWSEAVVEGSRLDFEAIVPFQNYRLGFWARNKKHMSEMIVQTP